MTTRHHALLLGALLAIGCSDATAPALKLNGTWITDSKAVGPIYSMTISTRGNLVAGTGEWFAEGCCSGPLALTGTLTLSGVRGAHAYRKVK